MIRLPLNEYLILRALEPGRTIQFGDIVRWAEDPLHVPLAPEGLAGGSKSDQSFLMAGVKSLADRKLVSVTERTEEELTLAEFGGLAAEEHGLPERRALVSISKEERGAVSLAELPRLLGKNDTRTEVKWLTKKGWCSRDSGLLVVTDAGRAALKAEGQGPDEKLIWYVYDWYRNSGDPLYASSIKGIDVPAALKLLRGRDDILRTKKRTIRSVSLTAAGMELKEAGIQPAWEVTQLTPDLLASGKWREVILKKYDPALATTPRYPGKEHPLQRVVQEVRRAVFEMGFEEVASPAIDTAFWVFDALFQPQDHPAREMQDTFYMAEPKQGRLPGEEDLGHNPNSSAESGYVPRFGHVPGLVERVARTHENGGDTGSTGWRYKWSADKARQLVLRTHTTAASIRALAANPRSPRKVFCIGKTFRRENTDQTHLAEFMQIDGIIIDEQATLATLFGTLEAFYKKMGAEEVRFRPSFFPYTEPSAEVFAKMGKLGWVEMCGAGIFRPEVTRPLGCTAPVLAWGGGVERIAMLRFGLDDIRKLYLADVDWLREARLCR